MTYRLGIIGMVLCLLVFVEQTHAQPTRTVTIIGHVYDAKTHQPLPRASILNVSTGTGNFTDSTGAFRITATHNNRIVFSYVGYFPDTAQVNALYLHQKLDITLKRNNFSISPVEIIGQRVDYGQDSARRNYWFEDALGQQKTRGWGAAEHPISALYDALSGRQKRLWRFQKDYKAYEERKYIESRVLPGQIQVLFGLKSDSLDAFLLWYDPPYPWVRAASQYTLLEDIKHAVGVFRRIYRKDTGFPAYQPGIR